MDPIHRRNDLLPNTRAELALPLQIGSQVIGALDVQSVEPNAFSFDDIEVLQVMANQLAIAIENVRLIDELSARADENEQLFAEAQASLQEIEALNRLLTRQGWQEYLRSRVRGGGLGYTLRAGDVMQDWHWSAGMQSAYQEQRVVVKGSEERPDSISLPLRVRGEVIGVVEVERDEDRIWTEEDVELVQALIERLSLALDNARLLEQADSLARREQLMNEISQNVQQAEDVDTLLQSALVELGRVLGASKGVVQLSPRGQTGQVFHTQSGDENGAPAGSDGSTSEEGQA